MEKEKTSVRASHPMIGLLTGELHQVGICVSQRQPRQAARGLLNCLDLVNPAHVYAELRKQLKLIGFTEKMLQGSDLEFNLRRVCDLRASLGVILWEHQYFSERAYEFRDLSGGRPRR